MMLRIGLELMRVREERRCHIPTAISFEVWTRSGGPIRIEQASMEFSSDESRPEKEATGIAVGKPFQLEVLFVGSTHATQRLPAFSGVGKSPTIRLLLPEIGPQFRECRPQSYYGE